jgi:surfactin synthase thioesterase subunit
VADITDQLGGQVDAIYGESLGAYIGLAVAATAEKAPVLFAASNSPPSVRERIRTEEISSIDDAVAMLTAMGGEIPAEVLRDPELADRVYPVLRDDLYLGQSFIDSTRETTTAGDIQVLAGALDTASTHLESWAIHTTGRCELTVLPGGHLLSAGDPSAVADVILNRLTGATGCGQSVPVQLSIGAQRKPVEGHEQRRNHEVRKPVGHEPA